jgi:hypothetical protein
MFHLASGFVGFEAAVSFNDFLSNYEKIVTVEDILVEGKVELTKDFGINDHNSLVEKMEAEDIFSEVLPKEQIQNLANYFIILPSEVAMKFWTVLGSGLNENTIAFHQTNTDDGAVSSYLVKMMTGKSEPETEEV